MRVGSLFAGIGGMDLGLERAGMEVVWQVEIDPFCRKVLAKHWPDVKRYEDVRDVGAHNLEPVDLICGGVPCQPVSQAAARSVRGGGWLWPEMKRILKEMRPHYALLENPESLRYERRGLALVLSDLSSLGYNARWQMVPASALGAPHKRARIWVVAYPNNEGEPDLSLNAETPLVSQPCGADRLWPDPPRGLGVADGVPNRMDRLRTLGNAVIPQVAEWIGNRIMESHPTPGARP